MKCFYYIKKCNVDIIEWFTVWNAFIISRNVTELSVEIVASKYTNLMRLVLKFDSVWNTFRHPLGCLCFYMLTVTVPDAWLLHLTHWGRVTHICVGKLTIIASDNGLAPSWTNAVILLIGPLGTKFNEISIEIHTFSFKKMHLKMSSAKWRPFCLGLNVLTHLALNKMTALSQTKFSNAFFLYFGSVSLESFSSGSN